MIHSLSGGVLSDLGVYTFAKVDVSGTPRWYLAPFPVEVGDVVLAPVGNSLAECPVLKVENCTPQTAPVPLNRAKSLQGKK